MRAEDCLSPQPCPRRSGSTRSCHGYDGNENSPPPMKRFRCGLVVGKFSPLHRGHEYVIRRAMEDCEEVAIISYSKPEYPGCQAIRRERWLAALFPQTRRLV